jgi:hypothetical protein
MKETGVGGAEEKEKEGDCVGRDGLSNGDYYLLCDCFYEEERLNYGILGLWPCFDSILFYLIIFFYFYYCY